MKVVTYKLKWLPTVDNIINVLTGGLANQMGLMTVLTVGALETDYAAYEGIVPDLSVKHASRWEEVKDHMADWVSYNGNKLSESEARHIFKTELEGEDYRK